MASLDVQVDLSKYHDARIDNQLRRNRLEPDVAMLQTTQDFDRWKAQGVLQPYKPAGWTQVEPRFKDASGAWVGTSLIAFTNVVNTDLVSGDQQALSYADYLEPQFKDQIALTYPNDDDAVLFQWKLIVDKYGWDYVDRLMAQNPQFFRGTPASIGPLVTGQKQVNFAALLPLAGIPGVPVALRPSPDPFVSWAQRAAIFEQARHPAGARLLMNWLLTKDVQQSLPAWSVRRDVPAPAGYRPISRYNTDPVAFVAFMRDRDAVERFRSEVELYVGAPTGANPAGVPGRGPFFGVGASSGPGPPGDPARPRVTGQ
jgi:ABC-type Fe3+ transport system substrate-binding protein